MDKIHRRKRNVIQIGDVSIGGENPISIQSMTNTLTSDISLTIAQIKVLESCGCEIVRVAVPKQQDAEAIREIKRQISIPIIADIHFDYQLALQSIRAGADKIRINPGNIGNYDHIKAIINCSKDYNIPIRIGVNAGSLEKEILAKHGHPNSDALLESILKWIDFFEQQNFTQLVLSVKSSNVIANLQSYQKLAQKTDYPLHVGVTEAGYLQEGIIKSAAGIGALLMQGIGDTLRVSLTGNPIREVEVAKTLLQTLGLRSFGPELISCPTCGRCQINLEDLVEKINLIIKKSNKSLKIAVMGCVVNGPGEAKEADLGIAGGLDKGIIFKRGVRIKTLPYDQLFDEFKKQLDDL